MYIYKISNYKNNKVYIGQTIRPIEKRFNRHINDAMNGVLDTHFARAIRLYGPDQFFIEQIDSASSQEELTQKEQYWIRYYNSVEEGYNETDAISKCGGNTYQSKTKEELDQIKEKIRQSKLGGNNPQSTKIKCFNIETNQEILFDSMSEATKYFNQTNHQFISRRCRGEIKNLYLGKWKFAYQDRDYGDFTALPNGKRTKQIKVTNLDTNESEIFTNGNAADRFCDFKIGYTTKKIKSIEPKKVFIRNNYQVELLN